MPRKLRDLSTRFSTQKRCWVDPGRLSTSNTCQIKELLARVPDLALRPLRFALRVQVDAKQLRKIAAVRGLVNKEVSQRGWHVPRFLQVLS